MSKMGRPLIGEKPKTFRCEIRLDENDLDNLNKLSSDLGESKSEIIREALNMYRKHLEGV